MCAWKFFFGFDCPGCGLTHAVFACLRGDVAGSIALHPMGITAVLWLVNFWWVKKLKLSELGQRITSYSVLLGFFVPWAVHVIASVSEAIQR